MVLSGFSTVVSPRYHTPRSQHISCPKKSSISGVAMPFLAHQKMLSTMTSSKSFAVADAAARSCCESQAFFSFAIRSTSDLNSSKEVSAKFFISGGFCPSPGG
jgi:hypothetical protein